ncbi:DNA recombination protein RmuC [Christensenellaceae bacterium NSJ-44]|uniref:DNA recombination protein RmuC n=2 Tax=Luoshenia tenuis TaxID=2763654 RepID=A0A926CYC1_9FIRM|nr:DNA recombination protein RmuC [Luoshenia tenuis]
MVLCAVLGILLVIAVGMLLFTRRPDKQMGRALKEEGALLRSETGRALAENRQEIAAAIRGMNDSTVHALSEITRTNDAAFARLRQGMEGRIAAMAQDNARQLEQMRQVVDERLQQTLERRLGESFQTVSQRLEQVHRGLGEMQVLAADVGDLRKVLTNVKARGTWGEVQLGAILGDILTPDQYATNVSVVPGSAERVEFAVKLPGAGGEGTVYLPIDAKFPQEDYLRLLEAQENGAAQAAAEAAKQLESRIRLEAKRIAQKYICPPHTVDFAIMYLPTEGLYAYVLQCPGLAERLQREHRVVLGGPTTLAALLNSLQMGFRTLAIEKRSSEVWALLGQVRTEFERFASLLEKTQKKLQEASNVIDDASRRTRVIQRKLGSVQGEAHETEQE